MKNEKNWYVVYTKPKFERKTAQLLSKKNIEAYCPLSKVIRPLADKKKDPYEPLFTSYVFVYATEAEHTAIRQTDGVVNFIYWLSSPVTIQDTEIDAIREFLEEHQTASLERIKVNANDRPKLTSGSFMQWEGSVIEVSTRRAKLLLPSFGYAMIAENEKVPLEPINSKRYIRAAYVN